MWASIRKLYDWCRRHMARPSRQLTHDILELRFLVQKGVILFLEDIEANNKMCWLWGQTCIPWENKNGHHGRFVWSNLNNIPNPLIDLHQGRSIWFWMQRKLSERWMDVQVKILKLSLMPAFKVIGSKLCIRCVISHYPLLFVCIGLFHGDPSLWPLGLDLRWDGFLGANAMLTSYKQIFNSCSYLRIIIWDLIWDQICEPLQYHILLSRLWWCNTVGLHSTWNSNWLWKPSLKFEMHQDTNHINVKVLRTYETS